MKKFTFFLVTVLLLSMLVSCSGNSMKSYTFKGSKDGVDDFLKTASNYDLSPVISKSRLTEDNFVNITPEEVKTEFGLSLLRCPGACTFLFDGQSIEVMANMTGGNGVTDVHAIDLNGDGTKELIFSISYKSGKKFGIIGIYDIASKTETRAVADPKAEEKLVFSLEDTDFCFDVSNGEVTIYKSETTADDANMKYTVNPGSKVGTLVYEDGYYVVRK